MNRLLVPKLTIFIVFVILVGRLYTLQLVEPLHVDEYNSGTRQYISTRPLRGEIYARDGTTLLAESVPMYTVGIRPADFNRAIEQEPDEGERIFAQLGQLLEITSTLTISPATALETDSVLNSDINQGLGTQVVTSIEQYSADVPMHVIVPSDRVAGLTELLEQYSPIVQLNLGENAPSDLSDMAQLSVDQALIDLIETLDISTTLTISPSSTLESDSSLRTDLQNALGQAAFAEADRPQTLTWSILTVPAEKSMVALQLSRAYSDTLTLNNPIAEQYRQANVPEYEIIPVQEDIAHELALVLRENATTLPGVVVEEDYQRRYPLSENVQSFSHILGYIRSINACQLVRNNPAYSWSSSLLDTVSHAGHCRGFIEKEIDPQSRTSVRYLEKDRLGQDGVEASYEDVLRGALGREVVVVDAAGRQMSPPRMVQPAQDGNNLVLTIDAGYQQQVEQILRNWIDEGERRRTGQSGAFAYRREYLPIRSGAAIVSEIKTGRILAMVSWPAYDNNIWVDPDRTDEINDFYPTDPEQRAEMENLAPLVNRAISGEYPPGSTLKQFDAAILLQKGVIQPNTLLFDPGLLLIQNEFVPSEQTPFPNAGRRYNGYINVSDALNVSSNVFFMSAVGGNERNIVNIPDRDKIIRGDRVMSVTEFAEGLEWFGFGYPTGIQLPNESFGRVPTPAWKEQRFSEPWTTGDTYNMSIGQGNMLSTPLQLLTASTAVAGDGTIYQPQLVEAVTNNAGETIQSFEPQVAFKADIAPEYLAVTREGMRRSITEGANRAARDQCAGLQIAGKTGTAEFGREVRPGEFQTHSWFVGFAPYDDPEIQVVVLSEGTGGLNDGSATIAVPAATQMLQAYFDITPPDPLPADCQQGLPPFPDRVEVESLMTSTRDEPSD
ncbi:MAG: peptidoglycan glycosyltransferase [Chloroflexi bacterium AL-N10]|nr:Cell division protein FtsI/penicillin-binding protein 2 [Chloroflexi bacterium AL-N1]NOK70805.1 peptidoglycan glycosyltransferase [Chloroflexi bacterium AL-N10]NOK78365.1 peptidoglycan glycosyltransferase [Chloroflexi bacterium AL-N5]NOK92622.1 peptidoglycan glycosyltransferase [Chloroflexi bacterium AL-N15]